MSKLAGFVMPARGKAYFFYGDRYTRYDIALNRCDDGYPKLIAGNWNGAFPEGIDAALAHPSGEFAYLFRANQYVKIDMLGNTLLPGYPRLIADGWPGVFAEDIDAATPALDPNFNYFFRESQYVKFDWAADGVDASYPRPIAGNWAGVYQWGIHTAVTWPNGNAYFFVENEYVRYDLNTNTPSAGYPQPLSNWPGLPELISGASAPPAADPPVAVENPGGGRVTDKRDPAAADLVTVDGPNNGKVPLHRLAAQFWAQLVAAARADGIADPLLLPVSGYRSSATQAQLFAAAVQKYGSEAEASRWVARPGGSAHQSGRAVDCWLGVGNDSGNVATQQASSAWAWLVANAERFGFYPYTVEPWHWEYNPPA
jgi:LAS superfamily LD-carboxypeptidase LdcB